MDSLMARIHPHLLLRIEQRIRCLHWCCLTIQYFDDMVALSGALVTRPIEGASSRPGILKCRAPDSS